MKNKSLLIDEVCQTIALRKLPTSLRSDIIKVKLQLRWSLHAKQDLIIPREGEDSRYLLPVFLKYNLTFPDISQQENLNVDIGELEAMLVSG